MFDCKDLMIKFCVMCDWGELIIGGGVGIGLFVKCEEVGGIDLIVIYNFGCY